MTKKTTDSVNQLRLRAEEKFKANEGAIPEKLSINEKRLFHKLQVHQIELEMQNEELRSTKDELEALNVRYFDLYDLAPLSYFTLSEKGMILEANTTAADLLGIERSSLIGLLFGKFIDAEYRLPFSGFLNNVFANKNKQSIEVTFTKKRYSPYFAKIEASAHSIEGVCRVAVIDITEQKMIELALKESEKRAHEMLGFNRSILNTSSIGITTYNTEGQCIFANEAAAKISGTDVAGLLEQNFHKFISWKKSGMYALALKALSTGSEETVESNIVTVFGRNVWLNRNFSSFISNGEKHLLVFTHDITLRKRAKEELENRLTSLTQPFNSDQISFKELFNIYNIQSLQDEFAEATGVASIITYPDGTPITAPSNFTRLCSEIIRKTEKGCSNCFKSDITIGQYNVDGPNIQLCLSGGLWDAGTRIIVGGHHVANWLVGQVRNQSQSDEKMRDYAREIEADEASFMDAFYEVPSMPHEQFERIARVMFTLANQLSTVAYQNIQQARFISERYKSEEELKKKNAEIEQFIYTVSHDLRSPLVTVKTFMGYLEKDMAEGKLEDLAKDVMYINGAADKMKLLLDELVELSRIGRIDTPSIDVSLREVLAETLLSLAAGIRERQVDIRLPDTDLILFGNRQRFCQIWQNLIENALKYCRDGSIPSIELGVQQRDSETVFFVKDNGIGIDPQYLKKIFGIFEKLDPKSPGAGMGLSMIERIVEKCGGRVWAESEGIGKGSCFYFTMPLMMVHD